MNKLSKTLNLFHKGNLIEHHVKILMNNPYYRGVAIPEPDVFVC